MPLKWNASNLEIIHEAVCVARGADVVDVTVPPAPGEQEPSIVRVVVNPRKRFGGEVIGRWRKGQDGTLEAEDPTRLPRAERMDDYT